MVVPKVDAVHDALMLVLSLVNIAIASGIADYAWQSELSVLKLHSMLEGCVANK